NSCGGGFVIPLYLPSTWASPSSAADLAQLIDNADNLLADYDISYRWMPKPDVNGAAMAPELRSVILEKCWWRMAFWSNGSPGESDFRDAIEAAILPGEPPCDAGVEAATLADVGTMIAETDFGGEVDA